MATLTLTYPFNSDAQSWVATDTGGGGSGASTGAWQSSSGNPNGCLNFSLGLSGQITWTVSGTWESFGIPSGATVTGVQLSSVDEKLTAVSAGGTISIGAYKVTDSSGIALTGNLLSSRSNTSAETSWTTRSGTNQTITSPDGVSTNSIKFTTQGSLFSGNTSGSGLIDNITIVITYTPGIPPTRTGSAALVHSHETLAAQGTFTYPRYRSSTSLTHSHETLTSQGSFISRTYTGSAALVHSHEILTSQGVRILPKYTGSAALNHSHELLASQGISKKPKFSAIAFLPHSHQLLIAQGRFFRFTKSSLNLFIKGVAAPSFVPIHNNIPLYIYGDTTTSQSRPHGSAGFIYSALNLYINGISSGIGNGTGSLNLYVNGISQFLANQITLYLFNNTNLIGKSATLYIRGDGVNPGFTPINSSLNLFVQGTGSNIVFPGTSSNSIPLFINGYISSANFVASATTLFIKVVEGNPINGNITLFIQGQNVGVANNSITLVIPHTKMFNTIPLYIHGF